MITLTLEELESVILAMKETGADICNLDCLISDYWGTIDRIRFEIFKGNKYIDTPLTWE